MAPGDSSIAEVAAGLRAGIYGGKYAPGAQLPTREKLAEQHGMSAESAGVALRMLRDEGLVSLEPGRGTFARPLTAYQVTVTVTRMMPMDAAERVARGIAARNAEAEAAEPAVTELALDPVDFIVRFWTWRMTVRAARPGLAAVIGESAARTAAGGELGDFARATVQAGPASA